MVIKPFVFTGTRKPVTDEQLDQMYTIMRRLKDQHGYNRIFHGCAKESDRRAHLMAVALGLDRELYPSNDEQETWASSQRSGGTTIIYPMRPPLDRNHYMLDRAGTNTRLIAVPHLSVEEIRSGTWATVRYARMLKRRITILWPDGRVEEEQ